MIFIMEKVYKNKEIPKNAYFPSFIIYSPISTNRKYCPHVTKITVIWISDHRSRWFINQKNSILNRARGSFCHLDHSYHIKLFPCPGLEFVIRKKGRQHCFSIIFYNHLVIN